MLIEILITFLNCNLLLESSGSPRPIGYVLGLRFSWPYVKKFTFKSKMPFIQISKDHRNAQRLLKWQVDVVVLNFMWFVIALEKLFKPSFFE
jgi:hypothetical protein